MYDADEADGIHKWHADPDQPDASRELAHFARGVVRGGADATDGLDISSRSLGRRYRTEW